MATTDLRMLVVDRSHFSRLLDETPDLVGRILTILSRRVRRLEQTVQAILRGTKPTADQVIGPPCALFVCHLEHPVSRPLDMLRPEPPATP